MKLTKKTIALTTAGIISLGVITAPLVADGRSSCGGKHGSGFSMMGGHHMGKDADHLIGKIAHKLDMTQEQRDLAFETVDEYRPKFRELKIALKDNMKSLHELQSSSPDFTEKTTNIADQQGDLVAQMIKLKITMHAGIEQILTDEQKAKFEKFKNRRSRHHDEREDNEAQS